MKNNFKATKTLVAVAIGAVISGMAFADTTESSVWKDKAEDAKTSITIGAGETQKVDVTLSDATDFANTQIKDVVVDGGNLVVTGPNRLINQGIADSTLVIKGGEVSITGNGNEKDTEDSRYDLAGTIDTNNVINDMDHPKDRIATFQRDNGD